MNTLAWLMLIIIFFFSQSHTREMKKSTAWILHGARVAPLCCGSPQHEPPIAHYRREARKCSNYPPRVLLEQVCFASRQAVAKLRRVMCWPASILNECMRRNVAQWLACLWGPVKWHRRDFPHCHRPGGLIRDDHHSLDGRRSVTYREHCLCACACVTHLFTKC